MDEIITEINRKPPAGWGVANIPDLTGKVALVTGATGGLGFIVARELVRARCRVILGGRNVTKGEEAVERIKKECEYACAVSFALIDHSELNSVREFAKKFNEGGRKLDILVNNAGVMATPQRCETPDGFELQMGTNHLSHFALTALLLPALRRAAAPRVVNVASIMANRGVINMDDLNSEQFYAPWKAYEQSKLANLLFTFELQRRSDEGGWGLLSLAAHPGISSTDLVANGPGRWSLMGQFIAWFVMPFFSHSPERAALPILYAASMANVRGYGYYGPNGWRETKGDVAEAWVPPQAKEHRVRKWLWKRSENLTGTEFPKIGVIQDREDDVYTGLNQMLF